MANYVNNDLFETTYTDPSGQDWKMKLKSLIPIYTGQALGEGASPPAAETGYVVRWTWSNLNDPETGGNYPGTTHIQVDDATGAPFTSYANAEAYTLASSFTDNTLIDHSTVEIVSAADSSIPRNWYRYNLDMSYPGVEIRWQGSYDNLNKSIMGSAASMSVWVDDYQEDILNRAILGAELNLVLSVYKKDDDGDFVDWWHGIALPETISMEVKDGRKLYDLSFADGLGLLNDIDWKDSNGRPHTGQISFKQAIMQSLRKLPQFGEMTFESPQVEVLGTDNSTATPTFALGMDTVVPGYTGTIVRVTNDVTMLTYTDLTAADDWSAYDGYKVMFWYDQVSGTPAYYQISYNSCPSLDVANKALVFDNSNSQHLISSSTTFFSGNLAKMVLVSFQGNADTPNMALIGQGDASVQTTAGECYHLQIENDALAHRFDGTYEGYNTATDAAQNNQVIISTVATPVTNMAGWQMYQDGTELTATGSTSPSVFPNTVDANSYIGCKITGGSVAIPYDGKIHSVICYNGTIPSIADGLLIASDLEDLFQNGVSPQPRIKGGWALSTYGTPLPVDDTYDNWDPSVKDPLSHMFCTAETFNEPKEEYDRKFEMKPKPTFISTGHVLEDICKTLGMVLVHWEGGYHLFSPAYLFKSTRLYLDTNDSSLAPYARRWTWNITDGLQESTYEQVDTAQEAEDFAAPLAGMTKNFTMPYTGVKMTHEKSPSDILYGGYGDHAAGRQSEEAGRFQNRYPSHHKLAAMHPGGVDPSTGTDLEKYGDATQGYVGNLSTDRTRRQGTMWSMTNAYNHDHYDFDNNGGSQGGNLSPRAQHKRLEDGVTGGGPNETFYDLRYLGPDSATINEVDLEAGETLNIEMGGYVENGRLHHHIGQTYIFHHRIQIEQEDGTKYRLRRHVITQDTWTDSGTKRVIEIDGSASDVDKSWPADKEYYIKEYDSLSWVKESDVSANEWEDAWYEVMTHHPETSKTDGDDLAEVIMSGLPYYGNTPMGTEWDSENGKLTVNKENRFAYVKADLSVELPGTEGVDEFTTLYVECGMSAYGPDQGPRPVAGHAGGASEWYSRLADGSTRKTETGSAIQIASGNAGGSTILMPYTMGWNKFIVRYGDQGEKNNMTTYADGGAGIRLYDAGSSRLGSRYVFNSPEYKGRVKVQLMDGSTFTDKTFNTQWRPAQEYYATTVFNNSLHEQVAYEYLDVLGYVRPTYTGSWTKHANTLAGGVPAPFLPCVTRNLDADAALTIMPYRINWKFAEGFQMEAVEVGDAYEKTRISFSVGDTATGIAGTQSAAITKLGGVGPQANQSAERPQIEIYGSSNNSVGGSDANYGPFNYMVGTNDGTGTYFEELWGTNSLYIDPTAGYSHNFGIADAATYGGSNLGRCVVEEPGLYMVEVKSRVVNNAASPNGNTIGIALHRLGTVSGGTYTGDTILKTSNIHDNIDFLYGTSGSGDVLQGLYQRQVRLDRGDLISFSFYNTFGQTNASIFTDPDQLKIRLVKLTEQQG